MPGWVAYEVSSLGRVRKVRILVGDKIYLGLKGRKRTTTSRALYVEAFGKQSLHTSSRLIRFKPGIMWEVFQSHLSSGPGDLFGLRTAVSDKDLKDHGVVTPNSETLRRRVARSVERFLARGLIERIGLGRYQLTDKGKHYRMTRP